MVNTEISMKLSLGETSVPKDQVKFLIYELLDDVEFFKPVFFFIMTIWNMQRMGFLDEDYVQIIEGCEIIFHELVEEHFQETMTDELLNDVLSLPEYWDEAIRNKLRSSYYAYHSGNLWKNVLNRK
jgi:hypothetical protein